MPYRNNKEQSKLQKYTLQAPKKNTESKYRMCWDPECTSGALCRFAHDPSELRIMTMRLMPDYYRTKLCSHPGSCKYGLNCHYAHNKKELRPFVAPTAHLKEQPCPFLAMDHGCRYSEYMCLYSHKPHGTSTPGGRVHQEPAPAQSCSNTATVAPWASSNQRPRSEYTSSPSSPPCKRHASNEVALELFSIEEFPSPSEP